MNVVAIYLLVTFGLGGLAMAVRLPPLVGFLAAGFVINALNVALQKFEGTVLLVTHDQDLIEEVGTRVWHFDHGAITDFKGTYEEYAATLA